MELIDQCYSYLFWGILVLLGIGILFTLYYIIRCHLTVDRIIGLNLIGTIVVIIIAILAVVLQEDYLADIAIVYVVLSFLAVIYINLYSRRQFRHGHKEEHHDR